MAGFLWPQSTTPQWAVNHHNQESIGCFCKIWGLFYGDANEAHSDNSWVWKWVPEVHRVSHFSMTLYKPAMQSQQESSQGFLKPKRDAYWPGTIQYKAQSSKKWKDCSKLPFKIGYRISLEEKKSNIERKLIEALDWKCGQNRLREKERKKKRQPTGKGLPPDLSLPPRILGRETRLLNPLKMEN